MIDKRSNGASDATLRSMDSAGRNGWGTQLALAASATRLTQDWG